MRAEQSAVEQNGGSEGIWMYTSLVVCDVRRLALRWHHSSMKSFWVAKSRSGASAAPTNSSTASESTSSLSAESPSSSLDTSTIASSAPASRAWLALRRSLALSRCRSLQPLVLQTLVLLKSGHSLTWRWGHSAPLSQYP